MHDTLARLLNFARLATKAQQRPVSNLATLRARMGISSQAMNNWLERGVSKEGAIDAERLFGCSPNWILSGIEPPTDMRPPHRFSAEEPAPRGWPQYRRVTEAEWAMLQDLKVLPEDERNDLTLDLKARAVKYRAYEKQVLARLSSTSSLDDK